MSEKGLPAHVLDAQSDGAGHGGASFTLRLRLVRALFIVTWCLLAKWTPPPLNAWRRLLLRAFGAKIAPSAIVYGTTIIWYPPFLEMDDGATLGPRVRCYNQANIRIGRFAIVSQDASLCAGTHRYNDPAFQLICRPIVIEDGAWVAAEAFVGPGVTVGKQAVLGARGVAMSDLDPGGVYSGNPARLVKQRQLPN